MSVSISPDDVTGADHGVLLMDSQAQDPISTVCLAQECVPGDVLSAATQMSTGNEMPHAMVRLLHPWQVAVQLLQQKPLFMCMLLY